MGRISQPYTGLRVHQRSPIKNHHLIRTTLSFPVPCVRKNSTRRASAVVFPPQGPPVSTILNSLGIPSEPTSPPLLCVASVRPLAALGVLRPLLMLPLCGALPKGGGDGDSAAVAAGGGPLPLGGGGLASIDEGAPMLGCEMKEVENDTR